MTAWIHSHDGNTDEQVEKTVRSQGRGRWPESQPKSCHQFSLVGTTLPPPADATLSLPHQWLWTLNLVPLRATRMSHYCSCFSVAYSESDSQGKQPAGPGFHEVRQGERVCLFTFCSERRALPPSKIHTVGNSRNIGRCFRRLAAKKMINDNRMLHRQRLHIQLILRNARFNRFLYYRAFNVIACMVNLQERLEDTLPLYRPMWVLRGIYFMNHYFKATGNKTVFFFFHT